MATTQNFSYPSSSDVTLTGSPNGAPIPSTSILVAGESPAGNQEPLQTDDDGNLNVNVISSTLPAGGATAANQVLEIAQLTGIHSDTASLDGKTVHVDTGNVTVAASALPSGASTSALQTTGNTSVASIDNKTPALGQALGAASVPVVLTALQLSTLTPFSTVTVVQPTGTNLHTVVDSGTLVVTQPTGTNLHTVVDSSALPSGASTSALQTILNAQIPTTLGQKASAASLAVVVASDQPALPVAGSSGRTVSNPPIHNNYAFVNITTSAYVQLIASTTDTTNYLDIFDSSGNAMILAIGASGSEVIQAYVPPGGDQIPLAIPTGSRVAYQALTNNSTSGYLLINLLK